MSADILRKNIPVVVLSGEVISMMQATEQINDVLLEVFKKASKEPNDVLIMATLGMELNSNIKFLRQGLTSLIATLHAITERVK